MKTADLSREIEHAVKAVRSYHVDELKELGVTGAAIGSLGAVQPIFGVMHCESVGGGIFQPDGVIPSIVQPVFDDGCLIDLVAWRTNAPHTWLWRTGAAWALGVDAVRDSSWTDASLTIDSSPLDWLRGGATGLCILNWAAPEIRALLRVRSISAEPAVALQLRRALMKPVYFPEISARQERKHAA